MTADEKALVKAWFAALQETEMLAIGRNWINKELQRDAAVQANLEELAHKLGFKIGTFPTHAASKPVATIFRPA